MKTTPYDQPYQPPAELQKAGILFSFGTLSGKAQSCFAQPAVSGRAGGGLRLAS